MSASQAKLSSVCLFVSRPNMRNIVKQHVKEHGCEELHAPENATDCINMLKAMSEIPLIIDWENGAEIVNHVLGQAQSPEGTNLREIYLIATEVNQDIVLSAAEYNVSRIHVGEITRSTIIQDLQYIAWRIATKTPLKTCLHNVSLQRKAGDHLAAAETLKTAHDLDPDNIRLALELAESMTHIQVWDEAARLAEGILSRDPSNLRAMHILGRCRMKAGRLQEAIEVFELASTHNRLKVDRIVEFGTVLLQSGRHTEAIKQFDFALSVDSESVAAKKGKGQCKLMIGEINDALEMLTEAAGGHEIAAIFNTCAIMSIKQSKFSAGIDMYRAALGALGKNPKVAARLHFNMGLAFYKDNFMNEAFGCFVKSVEADPQFISAAVNTRVLASLTGNAVPAVVANRLKPKGPTQNSKPAPFSDQYDFVSDFQSNIEDN